MAPRRAGQALALSAFWTAATGAAALALGAPPQRPLRYFATCAKGLEGVLAAELESETIGAARVAPGAAGVEFEGDRSCGYRAALESRCATRVLQLLAREDYDVDTARDLYDVARSIDWERYLPRGCPTDKSRRRRGCDADIPRAAADAAAYSGHASGIWPWTKRCASTRR